MFEDADTNQISIFHPDFYKYGAMRELSIHIKDFEEAVRFDELLDKEMSRQNIHYRGDDWNTSIPVVKNETQQLIEAESNGT